MKACFLLLGLSILLASCGGSKSGSDGGDSGGGGEKPRRAAYVNWEAVDSKFNPKVDEIGFQTDGVAKINVDAFSFDRDFEVIYAKDLRPDMGYLRVFKVWAKSVEWYDVKTSRSGQNLDLKNYGMYKCSIRVQNGEITALEGGCYVRLQVVLPVGSEIEVYNLGHLMTQRFIPMDNQSFLEQLDRASWAKDKFAVIEDFLASYTGSRKPSVTSSELGKAIHEFSFTEEKFKALKRLHSIVSDRQNLGTMIENEFSFFDREEARKIVGLN